MKKLIFNFDKVWLVAIETLYKEPLQQLKITMERAGAKSIVLDGERICVEIEEEQRQFLIENVLNRIIRQFEETNPFIALTITGDVEGIETFLVEKERELMLEDEKKREELFQKLAERLEKTDEVNSLEEKPESVAEEMPKLTAEERLEKVIETICQTIPVKYTPSMEKYIRELGKVLPMLKKMDELDCIWSRNLLISVDEGFGYTSFLKFIGDMFWEYDLLETGQKDLYVVEMIIERNTSDDRKYSSWEKAVSRAETIEKENAEFHRYAFFSLDINQWQTELKTERVMNYLRQISEHAKNFICVFKVPFMELPALQRIGERLADVMSIQALSIPSVSMENMVAYLENELVKAGFLVSEECQPYFEQWLLKEKSDDTFFGFETLNKMVRELIYKKAILNCESGELNMNLTPEDMEAFLEEPYKETDPYELLNDLVGIAQIKQYIKELVIQIKTQKELAEQGQSIDRPCIHMMFTGNPGTGKTTVARILARILREEGVLRKGLFFEVHGRSLCGNYVGHTAPKTSAYCRDAYGSVLFIDEAYSLYQRDTEKDFGREAIHTLIAEMENHRDDFCVIMAGYKEQMYELFEANPGLKSRIPYEIEFPNYTKTELEEIFFAMLNGKFEYSDELKKAAHRFFDTIPEEVLNAKDFSNARFVRNLFEKVWGKAAYRRNIEGKSKLIIEKVDLDNVTETMEIENVVTEKPKHKIGFSYL